MKDQFKDILQRLKPESISEALILLMIILAIIMLFWNPPAPAPPGIPLNPLD